MTGCSLAFGKTGIVTGGNAKVSMKHSSVQNFNLGCQMLDAAQVQFTVVMRSQPDACTRW